MSLIWIFSESLFTWSAETLIFSTVERIDVLPAKSLVFDKSFFDKSFMSIRKNKRSKTESWGTPASTGSHDVWTYKLLFEIYFPESFLLIWEAYNLFQHISFCGLVHHTELYQKL